MVTTFDSLIPSVTSPILLPQQQNVSTANDGVINQRIDAVNELVENLSLDVDANANEIQRLNETDLLADVTFDATFNVNAYETCTTTELSSCTVPLRVTSEVSVCFTRGANPYNVTVS